ncbi:MAG: DNA polymerase III subunit delta [Patescibacteria group bacterium]|nr:DNA polymerase III subunit delta [Patescibacteria group bacterium]
MLIFLYGENTFRLHRFLQETKNRFTKEVASASSSLDILDGQTIVTSAIIEKINTGSLFARKRLLIIDNLFRNKKTTIFKEILDYLPKIENRDDLVVIFKEGRIVEKSLNADGKKLFNFLKKQKFSQEFKNLSPASLNNFIKKEAELYNKKINQAACDALIRQSDDDLWLISQSIKKAALATDKELIDLETISFYIVDHFKEDIFALTDAISNKNRALALKILEEQFAAEISDEFLIVMLARQFKILIRIKSALAKGLAAEEIAQTLKIHPFVVKKGIPQANNFSINQLKYCFNKIIEFDKKNKTGEGELKSELLLLISNI